TASPFYHYHAASYGSSPQDFPASTTQDRASQYEGGQASLSWVVKRNNLRAGLFGFAQQDNELFGLLCHDPQQCVGLSSPEIDNSTGSLVAVYAEDQLKADRKSTRLNSSHG